MVKRYANDVELTITRLTLYGMRKEGRGPRDFLGGKRGNVGGWG